MKTKTLIPLLAIGLMVAAASCSDRDPNKSAKPDEARIGRKVNELLSKMTIEEKVGQMTQVTIDVVSAIGPGGVLEPHAIDTARLRDAVVNHHVGSILNVKNHCYSREHWYEIITAIEKMTNENTRLKVPVLYGIDAIHGASYTEKATLFPQQIAMAATFNPGLVEQAAAITAYETRASYIPWTFSPVLDMGRHPAWPRMWETFGEDVLLARTMGVAMIKGYEGDNVADKYKVASCLKHYMGYSYPLSGKDRTQAWIPENYLREIFLPPFADALKAGAHSIMVNSAEINGTPVHADRHILTDITRVELGFRGLACSDWEDIIRLYTVHHVAATPKEAVKMAVMAGIDMSMVPLNYSFYDYLLQLVKEGEVPESRINEAVSRILRLKVELGLFDQMYFPPADYPKFASEEFRLASLETAREAITLLKNENNVLPLPKTARVLVTGFAATSMRCLNGGWTYSWQGELTDKYADYKSNILEAVQAKIGEANVLYAQGTAFDTLTDAAKAVSLARSADYVVLCLGELSYCEVIGNINDLYLPDAQAELARQLAATGKPVILVLTEGRPRLISKFAGQMKGVVQTYLPGNEGGLAIADVLFGDVNPSGKLPYTYPRYPNDLVLYDHKLSEDSRYENISKMVFNPQFRFGDGLSYTTFSYNNLNVSKQTFTKDEKFTVSVDVANTGKLKGKEVVQLYIRDVFASISPSVKKLRGFKKIGLSPGEKKTVSFEISASDLAFVNRDLKWVTEPGTFEVQIAGLKKKIELK